MKPSCGGRRWVKLWVNEWLEGTTRYQMSDAQRAFWIDLLAMAGRSQFGGVVCSGKDGDQFVGYPLAKFQGLLSGSIDVLATFELFRRTGKIELQVDGETPKLYTIFILSWARYQSEYERTKKYRTRTATPKSTEMLHPKSRESNTTEGEGDVEQEGEKENNSFRTKRGKTTFPESFSLSEDMNRFAWDLGLKGKEEFAAFRDFHTANASRFVDWEAAWRTWCRKAARIHAKGPKSPRLTGAYHGEPEKKYTQPKILRTE
ncbi:MAG TPA: hypothetical protein VGS15_00470 [Candidatus Acidoferrales bacterium]|nr:hypothetical protein [Candidatus Acidoferrales bacterium]